MGLFLENLTRETFASGEGAALAEPSRRSPVIGRRFRIPAWHANRFRVGYYPGTFRFTKSLEEDPLMLTVAHIQPIVSLLAGILILIMPQLLNYIVAIYLIVVGITGLGLIH
jgi:Protein of unknown function (DUF3096)